MLKVSEHGLNMIMAFEGFSAKVYKCPAGVATQGYGHTEAAGGEPLGGVWTKEKARTVLNDDLNRIYAPAVWRLTNGKVTQSQFDALVSFAYNCGENALKRSSILKFHKRGDYTEAASSFGLWVKAGGVTLAGLVRRRNSEALAYHGFKDENFDGRYTDNEGIYGAMPQAVTRAKEKVLKSKTAQGSTAGMAGGFVVVAGSLKDMQTQLESAQAQISAGTWLGLVIGTIIIIGTGCALYARFSDGGRQSFKEMFGW